MSRWRIVSWNIRAGGGRRVAALAGQLARWRPDAVALSEFRATPPSLELASRLAAHGLVHQLTTASPRRLRQNALLIASRWPLAPIRLTAAPAEPGRWLLVRVGAPAPFELAAMHVPNRVTGRKFPFLDAVLAVAHRWERGPALLVGDTNTGLIGLDEEVPVFVPEEDGWIRGLAAADFTDAFRHLRGAARAYTWYSPNGGNGFRLDQAFVNRDLLPWLRRARYAWGAGGTESGRRDALSDHAALIVDILPPAASLAGRRPTPPRAARSPAGGGSRASRSPAAAAGRR